MRVRIITTVCVGLTAIYLMRLNTAAGLMVDDAYYVLLGKALAEGEGYRLVSSGTVAMLPLYPPGFPFILSLIFRFVPEFPANVFVLKSVSIAAMLGVAILTFAYLRQRRVAKDLSACIAVAVATTPAFVFLATSTVMSECVFTLAQLAAVLLIDRGAEIDRRRGDVHIAIGGLLAASAVLIRSAGLGLVAAGVVWLAKRRQWTRAVLFGCVTALCVLPWMTYSRLHAPTKEERIAHGGAIVYSYQEQVWMRWAGVPSSGTISIKELPERIATNIVDIFARGIGGIFTPVLLRGSAESGEEVVSLGGVVGIRMGSMGNAGATMAISLMLSGIVILGFIVTARQQVTVAELLLPISIAIVLMWPFWSFRFLLPLAPYLFLYLATGIGAIVRRLHRMIPAITAIPLGVTRVVLLCVIGLNLSDHLGYVLLTRTNTSSERRLWVTEAHEIDAAMKWMHQNAKDGIVATTNPALVYLRTGRKTISFDGPVEELRGRSDDGVRYVASFVPIQQPDSPAFRVVYRTPSGFWVARIEPPPD